MVDWAGLGQSEAGAAEGAARMHEEADTRFLMSEVTPETVRIKTYIIETDLLLAKALETALAQEPDLHVVGCQSTMLLADERILRAGADVLLLQATPAAIDLIARLQSARTAPRTILMTSEAESELLIPAIVAGASGFLTSALTVQEMASAIRRAHAGWGVFTIEQIATLCDHCTTQVVQVSALAAPGKLTAREREILQVLATGASISEAADRLLMSTYTAQTHLKNAMRKLAVTSKLAAVMTALRAGIIQI
jgi:DNA-binding NarL/FixJ family response regulator